MATSKREEERNEKIIRGLMKLPPNRRCINCNSLGPQYVCCNFWTFVCTTCSGIHREFTHRVKSVSMSKFTSQEVEALQNGGNQRARETYLKDWDLQRQRFPNSSDVDKVREFIKAVYVNQKYASGNKSDKPTKDSQTERNDVDDTRRASSYHSYSQSPPYDFQYEDRLNRKQGAFLSRKPGSDRGQYVRKAASFVYSPGRFSDNLSEDRFANEGTSSRVSDYSASSGGDPFRSAPQSPNLQRDDGFSSPNFESSKELVDGLQHQRSNSSSEMFATRDADKIPVPRPQKIVSSRNFGSFQKNPGSLQSVDPAASSAPCSSQAVDFFQAPTTVSFQPDQTSSSSSLSYFTGDSQCPTNFISKLPQQPETANDGWATFDLPQPTKPPSIGLNTGVSGTHPKDGSSFKKLESFSSPNNGMQCPDFQSTTVHKPGPLISNPWTEDLQNTHVTSNITSTQVLQSTTVHRPGPLISNPWTEDLQNTHVTTNMTSSQPWNAFGETDVKQQQQMEVQGTDLPISVGNGGAAPNLFVEPWSAFGETDVKHMQHVDMHGTVLQTSVENSSSALNLFPEDSTTPDLQKLVSTEGFSFPDLSSHLGSTLPYNQPIYPFRSDVADIEQKSSNPFDVSFDSSFEASNAFLSMSSLQAALPKTTLPSPYAVGLNDSWFPPNLMDSQGGMSYLAAQPTSPRLSNIPTHGPAASVGGNPFA